MEFWVRIDLPLAKYKAACSASWWNLEVLRGRQKHKLLFKSILLQFLLNLLGLKLAPLRVWFIYLSLFTLCGAGM